MQAHLTHILKHGLIPKVNYFFSVIGQGDVNALTITALWNPWQLMLQQRGLCSAVCTAFYLELLGLDVSLPEARFSLCLKIQFNITEIQSTHLLSFHGPDVFFFPLFPPSHPPLFLSLYSLSIMSVIWHHLFISAKCLSFKNKDILRTKESVGGRPREGKAESLGVG